MAELWLVSLALFLRPAVRSAPSADLIGLLVLLCTPPIPGSEKCIISADGAECFDRFEVREEDCPLDNPLFGFFRRVVSFEPVEDDGSSSWPPNDDFLGESTELVRLEPLALSDLRREGESRGGVSKPVVDACRPLDFDTNC